MRTTAYRAEQPTVTVSNYKPIQVDGQCYQQTKGRASHLNPDLLYIGNYSFLLHEYFLAVLDIDATRRGFIRTADSIYGIYGVIIILVRFNRVYRCESV